jgi:hypothetical protein
VADHVKAVAQSGYLEDGVPHQLTRAVIGDVPATIDMMYLGSDAAQLRLRDEQIGTVPISTDRVGVRVLEKQQIVVRAPATNPTLPEGSLEIPGLGI